MQLNDNPESYPAWTSLSKEKQDWIRLVADAIKTHLRQSFYYEYQARCVLNDANMELEELLALNCLLESYEKAALKRQNH
jgi:hypothetical protein